MEKIKLQFASIAPNVLFVESVRLNPNVPDILKTIYDYRIHYICSGKEIINIDNHIYNGEAGDLFFWGPATTYRVEREHTDTPCIINISFNFTQNYKDENHLPSYISADKFEPDKITELIEFTDNFSFNSHFYIKNFHNAQPKLLDIANEYKLQKLYYREQINGYLQAFLMELARYITVEGISHKGKNYTVDHIISYIHSNYDKPLTNKMLSETFNFHPNYINKLMTLAVGMSLHQYVLKVKMQKAVELLRNTNLTATQIAQDLGFTDVSHFSNTFKRLIGFTPSKFLK